MTSKQPCHLPGSKLRADWPDSDPTLLCPQTRPASGPEARQENPCSLLFQERESPESSPAVHAAPLLVFPESNRPFVNSAISQSARSISSDSHSICSPHFPEGWVGAVPAPSLRLPLPQAPSASLGTLITWAPVSTSNSPIPGPGTPPYDLSWQPW